MKMEPPIESPQTSSSSSFLFGRDGKLRSLWRAVLFLLFQILLYAIAERIYTSMYGPAIELPNGLFYLLLDGFLLLESWVMLALLDRRSFRTLGLWFYRGWISEASLGLGMGALLATGTIGLLAASRSMTYAGFAGSEGKPALHWLMTAVLLFLAAASEELVFRGYLLQRLTDSLGAPAAVLVLSVLFGLGHLLNPFATIFSTVNTILMGILLSLAYLRTRALWLPIGLHFAWNLFLGPVFSLPVSGMVLSPELLRPQVAGGVWLTGGLYGPEGGAAVTLVCALGILWLARERAIGVSSSMREVLQ